MSAKNGAISPSDCSVASILQPFVFDACSVAPGGSGAMDGLQVTASTASLSSGTLFFTTATAVYRVLLQVCYALQVSVASPADMGEQAITLDMLANSVFTSIGAIAVDYDAPEATVVVVGDGTAVRMIDVFTRKV